MYNAQHIPFVLTTQPPSLHHPSSCFLVLNKARDVIKKCFCSYGLLDVILCPLLPRRTLYAPQKKRDVLEIFCTLHYSILNFASHFRVIPPFCVSHIFYLISLYWGLLWIFIWIHWFAFTFCVPLITVAAKSETHSHSYQAQPDSNVCDYIFHNSRFLMILMASETHSSESNSLPLNSSSCSITLALNEERASSVASFLTKS